MTLSCAQWANVTGLDYALHNLYLPSPPGCLVSTKNLWARSTRPFPSTCRCWKRGRQRYRGSLSRRTPTNKLRSQSTVKKLRRQWTKSFRLVFCLRTQIDLEIFQVTDFVERLMKHASNGEVLMFKKPLDARLHQLIASNPELNLATVAELEFISNFQAIQVCSNPALCPRSNQPLC